MTAIGGTERECYVFLSKEDAMNDTKTVMGHYCRGDYGCKEYKTRIGTGSIYRLFLTRNDESIEIEIFEKEL